MHSVGRMMKVAPSVIVHAGVPADHLALRRVYFVAANGSFDFDLVGLLPALGRLPLLLADPGYNDLL